MNAHKFKRTVNAFAIQGGGHCGERVECLKLDGMVEVGYYGIGPLSDVVQ